uniref:SLC2A4 regulator n=1 Tax=Spermophilus dauricus TaxID=99837 RepID=A0A8C9PG68_SPEDA
TSTLTPPLAPRPASMDLLRPHWLEVPRSSTRPQAAPSIFPPQQLPKASPVSPSPFIGPEDTYSNIGLALGQGRGLEYLLGPTHPSLAPVSFRSPPGKAQLDEVLAAAALTSLSTSPLYLGAPAVSFSPEPDWEPWREALTQPTGSYSSSSNSGDWVWDQASDQSSPSTPSPPLPPEAAHFLFGEPAQRKRKSAVQVVFQCLWKSCGKVLRTASAIQRHIRLVHLGRRAEPEHSDGEEDFYYTELDIGVDMLTNGLSNLAPTSPEAPVPPAFPHLDLPSLLRPLALPLPPLLSSARSPSCSSPQGCLAPVHVDPQPTEGRATAPALPSKLGASLRKPRGDAKKCRKVYGTDHRDLWCTACRWKKACQRFLD